MEMLFYRGNAIWKAEHKMGRMEFEIKTTTQIVSKT